MLRWLAKPWLRIGLAVALLVVGLAPVGAPILSDSALRQALGATPSPAPAPAYTYRYSNQANGTAQIERSAAGTHDWRSLSTLPAAVLQLADNQRSGGAVFARTADAIWRSQDAGGTWARLSTLPGRPLAMAVAQETPGLLLAGTQTTGLQTSNDNGTTWHSAGGPLSLAGPGELSVPAVSFNPTDEQVIYATTQITMATPSSGLHSTQSAYTSVDGGRHWFAMTAGAANADTANGNGNGGLAITQLLPVPNRPLAVTAKTADSTVTYQVPVEPTLIQGLSDQDAGIRAAAARALGLSGDQGAVAALLKNLHDSDLLAGDNAAEAVGRLGDPSALPTLLAALKDSSEAVRARAALALGLLKSDEAVPQLTQMLQNDGPLARGRAGDALAAIGTPAAISGLMAPLADDDLTPARHAAMQGLEEVGGAAAPALTANLTNADPVVRRNSAEMLGWIHATPATGNLAQALKDNNAQVRGQAAWALGEIGTAQAGQALAQAATIEHDPTVIQAISQARAHAQQVQTVGAGRAPVADSPLAAFMAALSQIPASRWTFLVLAVCLVTLLFVITPRQARVEQRSR